MKKLINDVNNKEKTIVYFIEGLPSVGKTTISEWLCNKVNGKLIVENSSNFPNDLFNIVAISKNDYLKLVDRYRLLDDFSKQVGEFYYLNSEGIIKEYPDEKELYQNLINRDIGEERNTEISFEDYKNATLEIITSRINDLANNDIVVMDSVWLQNPINELISRNILDKEIISDYCKEFARRLDSITSVCIYLERETSEESIKEACTLKGTSWQQGVSKNLSTTPFAIENGIEYRDVLMRYFSLRAEIEQSVLSKNYIKTFQYIVRNNDWESVKNNICNDLEIV